MATNVNIVKFFSRTAGSLSQPTVGQIIRKWSKIFKNHGLEDYKLSAEYLVDYICNSKRKKVDLDMIMNTQCVSVYIIDYYAL